MTELWDAYDNEFNKIKDVTLVRGEPIPNKIYHLVCEIIVKHIELLRKEIRDLRI